MGVHACVHVCFIQRSKKTQKRELLLSQTGHDKTVLAFTVMNVRLEDRGTLVAAVHIVRQNSKSLF